MRITGMRIAAGIMLIVFGALSWIVPAQWADYWIWIPGVPASLDYPKYPSLLILVVLLANFLSVIELDKGIQTQIAGTLLVVLIAGGGVCALTKRYYWWAFSGALCLIHTAVIGATFWLFLFLDFLAVLGRLDWVADFAVRSGMPYVVPGLLALIFLAKSEGQFLKLLPKRAPS